MKRLVICFDGTWNSPERGRSRDPARAGATLYKPTNVLKLYRALLPRGDDGVPQVALYLEGVGAFVGESTRGGRLQAATDRLFGGLFGGGFEGRVKTACRFLVGNYQPGDAIHVVGFSRGAAQAASLVRFLAWAGGLLRKRDEYFLPELFERFRVTRARSGAGAETLAAIRARSGDPESVLDPFPAEIAFLGLFDPVLALGSRLRADRLEGEVATVEKGLDFHAGRDLPDNVRVARVALAVDESRWDFRPVVWRAPAELPDRLGLRWFPGVHSNVGGGYAQDGLANFALYWMASEARAAGLDFDRDYLANFRPHPKGDRPDERRGWMRFTEWARDKSGHGVRRPETIGGEIDDSVWRLLLEDETYRPANLLRWIRARPAALAGLPDETRRRVLEIAST